MPIPYANSDSAGSRALISLGIYGQGATANQQPKGLVSSFEVLSTGTHVLTGSYATLATTGSITYVAGQKASSILPSDRFSTSTTEADATACV